MKLLEVRLWEVCRVVRPNPRISYQGAP